MTNGHRNIWSAWTARQLRRTSLYLGMSVCLALGFASSRVLADDKMKHVGLFHVGLDHVPPSLPVLRRTLRELGWIEGKNLRFDWRNQADEAEARRTAQDFVNEHVDVIVAFENQVARAAKAVTSDVPVVCVHFTDPVAEGLIQSLARPGGNMTGFIVSPDEAAVKRLELFKQLVPGLRRILVLFDPRHENTARQLPKLRRGAETLGLDLVERALSGPEHVAATFRELRPGDIDGVLVASGASGPYGTVLKHATTARLPMAAHRKEWVAQGALFSYAPDVAPAGKYAAQYVDRILKGAKPADLPAVNLDDYRLIVNLKTAARFGLKISDAALARADEVIE